jgi:hypothetical protein
MRGTVISTGAIAQASQPLARLDDIGVLAARARSVHAGAPSFEPTPVLTRQLDFRSDSDGYLINSEGLYLVGPCSSARSGQLEAIRLKHAERMPARPTRIISYDANLPAIPVMGCEPVGGGSLIIVGDDGAQRLVMLRWTRAGEARRGAASVWRLGYLIAGRGDRHASMGWNDLDADFGFTADGRLLPQPDQQNSQRAPAPLPRYIELASQQRAITLHITGLSQFADTSGLVTIRTLAHDGVAAGKLSKLVITCSGTVLAHYANGTHIHAGTALTARDIDMAQGAA